MWAPLIFPGSISEHNVASDVANTDFSKYADADFREHTTTDGRLLRTLKMSIKARQIFVTDYFKTHKKIERKKTKLLKIKIRLKGNC